MNTTMKEEGSRVIRVLRGSDDKDEITLIVGADNDNHHFVHYMSREDALSLGAQLIGVANRIVNPIEGYGIRVTCIRAEWEADPPDSKLPRKPFKPLPPIPGM